MFKNKTFLGRLFTILASAVMFLAVGAMVVLSEREKKLNKTREYYAALEADWRSYKDQYNSEVARLRSENQKTMVEVKAEYERLLAEQPKLIAEHTRTVAETATSTANNVATVSSNNQTVTQTIKISKPKSKPTTQAS